MQECISTVSKHFEVLEVEQVGGGGRPVARILLGLPLGGDLMEGLSSLYKDLVSSKCYPYLYRSREGLVLLVSKQPPDTGRSLAIAAGLALLTLASVYVSGLALSGGEGSSWSPLAYLVGLLVPLAIHELGHMAAMLVYGVPRSPPYFIPAPPLQLGFLGTFGAVINLRWLPPTSESLAVIGIMGPLAGFLAALPMAVVGLRDSIIVPESAVPEESIALPVAPLIFAVLGSLKASDGYVIILSPLAFASYIVFLITFLNLIPIGSLDGGHVVRGATSEAGHSLATIAAAAIGLAAAPIFPPAALFVLIAFGFYVLAGGKHPGPSMADGDGGVLVIASALVYGILIALTVPVPVI